MTDRYEEFVFREGFRRGYEKGKADRPRGEWLERNSGFLWWIRCSACDHKFFHGDKTNFCPQCGADMRGEDNEV